MPKIYFYLYLVLCFLPELVFSQSSKIDSLQEAIVKHSKNDKVKVDLLYKLHNAYVDELKFDSAQIIFRKAEETITQVKDNESFAKVGILKAYSLSSIRKNNDAIFILKEAYEKIKQSNNNQLKFYLLTEIGVNFYANYKLDSSLVYYKKAIQYIKGNSVDLESKLYTNISQSFTKLKIVDSVLYYNNKIKELAFKSHDYDVEIDYYVSQVRFYQKLNQKDSVFRFSKLIYKKTLLQRDSSFKYRLRLNKAYAKIAYGYYFQQ